MVITILRMVKRLTIPTNLKEIHCSYLSKAGFLGPRMTRLYFYFCGRGPYTRSADETSNVKVRILYQMDDEIWPSLTRSLGNILFPYKHIASHE